MKRRRVETVKGLWLGEKVVHSQSRVEWSGVCDRGVFLFCSSLLSPTVMEALACIVAPLLHQGEIASP